MATEAVVRVVGAKELRAGLKRAGHDLGEFKAVHLEIAQVVAGAARLVAPVGDDGRTRDSIRPGATQRAAIVRVGSARLKYPAVDHYGSPKQHIKANPWLVNVAHAEEPRFIPIYERYIETVIDRV